MNASGILEPGRCRWLIGLALLCLLCLPARGVAQEDMRWVQDSACKSHSRPPVPFVHDEHNDAAGIDDCAVCHHQYRDGRLQPDETSEDMECSACHLASAGKRPIALVRAYHQRCKGCHMARQAGPVRCDQCHP